MEIMHDNCEQYMLLNAAIRPASSFALSSKCTL